MRKKEDQDVAACQEGERTFMTRCCTSLIAKRIARLLIKEVRQLPLAQVESSDSLVVQPDSLRRCFTKGFKVSWLFVWFLVR